MPNRTRIVKKSYTKVVVIVLSIKSVVQGLFSKKTSNNNTKLRKTEKSN